VEETDTCKPSSLFQYGKNTAVKGFIVQALNTTFKKSTLGFAFLV
jgi:hypothetical protein